jgi:DNA helicase-2/ATP-dependent DNA helicase PcrA
MDRSFAGGGARNQGGSFGNERSAYERMHGGSFGNTASQAEKRYGPPPTKKETKPAYVPPKPYTKTIEHNPSPDFVPSDTSSLQVGQKVEHQKFGFGEVVGLEGSNHNPIATVKFQYNGEKKIMLNYAKLRIVE